MRDRTHAWFGEDERKEMAVDVAGVDLTDNPAVPGKWQIPTDASGLTTIPARGHLVIWLDNDGADAGLHANFELDAAAIQNAARRRDPHRWALEA